MKRTQPLLPITHWLVDAAAFICMLVCGLLADLLVKLSDELGYEVKAAE